MKIHISTAALLVMGLAVRCNPVKYTDNGRFLNGYYSQSVDQYNGYPENSQNPQFNNQQYSPPGDYGLNQNQEAALQSDGNFNIQPNPQLEAEQTAQGSIPQEYPNLNVPVTQDAVPEAPAKEDRQVGSDEDDDDDESYDQIWNVSKLGKQNPSSVNFFPVSFGSGRGRSGGSPVGTVAIANSFSTGRRGVATSNANANPQLPSQQ